MFKKSIAVLTASALLCLSACSGDSSADVTESSTTGSAGTTQVASEVAQTSSENINNLSAIDFSADDYLADLSTSSVSFTDGDDISISSSGTYYFTGDYSSSTIVVNVNKDIDEGAVYLVLDNASFTSSSASAIYVLEAKDVVIVLEGDNYVSQGAIVTTDEDFPTAAVYTKADTVITGGGSLTVTTEYLDGINSRDDLIIDSCTLDITAIEDGIVGKDFVSVTNADITITSGKDGIKTSNDTDTDKGEMLIQSSTFNITALGDGISAENTLQIDSGTFNIASGGGYTGILNTITMGEGSGNSVQATDLLETSMKGIKALNILINAGEFNISAYEDGMHANNEMEINGGTIVISTGDDAVHADVSMVINDVSLTVENGYEGIESDSLTINGGVIWISALDDAINCGGSDGCVTITGGEIYLTSQGDGIDSNGDLVITGGNLVIDNNAIYSGGDGAIDVTGTTSISGGSIVDSEGNAIDASSQMSGMGGRTDTMQQGQTGMTGMTGQTGMQQGGMSQGGMSGMGGMGGR